jgi:hypothetical protein
VKYRNIALSYQLVNLGTYFFLYKSVYKKYLHKLVFNESQNLALVQLHHAGGRSSVVPKEAHGASTCPATIKREMRCESLLELPRDFF